MKILNKLEVPIKVWADDVESGAIEQASNIVLLPFIHSHLALMPDVHQGYGMPIGGVLATHGAVIPSCVGVDIGCGMCAVETSIEAPDADMCKKIMSDIRKAIPLGFDHRKKPVHDSLMPNVSEDTPLVAHQYESARKQLGTLGGGNHFIELQKDEKNILWIMIHSGSRNLGHRVCQHYNKEAKESNATWYSKVDPKWDLAFLPMKLRITYNYIAEMQYCVDFALANRKLMMEEIQRILVHRLSPINFCKPINVAHNYAKLEHHFGKNVWVHRKGATSAKSGEIGIIPGSQGTCSYIVEGLGNPDSFNSCSHGAGRLMSRTAAKKELDLEEQKKVLDDQGIVHTIRNPKDLDEAPGAYKDIDEVMNNQKDLVKITTKLQPIAVIKG